MISGPQGRHWGLNVRSKDGSLRVIFDLENLLQRAGSARLCSVTPCCAEETCGPTPRAGGSCFIVEAPSLGARPTQPRSGDRGHFQNFRAGWEAPWALSLVTRSAWCRHSYRSGISPGRRRRRWREASRWLGVAGGARGRVRGHRGMRRRGRAGWSAGGGNSS